VQDTRSVNLKVISEVVRIFGTKISEWLEIQALVIFHSEHAQY